MRSKSTANATCVISSRWQPMARAGLEPAPLAGQAPKTCVAASYTTGPMRLSLRHLAGGRNGRTDATHVFDD
jgi:hypothetical protein